MTVVDQLLLVGWIGFLAVGVSWHAWQVLSDYRARRPVPPRRYLLQRTAIAVGNAVWLALIGLRGRGDLLSLAFTFAVFVIPAAAMALRAGYRADRSRYEWLRSQGRGGSPGDS